MVPPHFIKIIVDFVGVVEVTLVTSMFIEA